MAHQDSSSRSSPPVALRVVRPYKDEGELLAVEANAFTRTGVVLIGAPSRPNGVVLRFEMVLRDGSSVMRGEGRVVGYRPPTSQDEGALMLRFTRLDVKSKTLLDRAVALRDEVKKSMPPTRTGSNPAMAAVHEPPAAHELPSPSPSPPRAVPSAPSAPSPPRPSLPSAAPMQPSAASSHHVEDAFGPKKVSPSAQPPRVSMAPIGATIIDDDDEDDAEEVDDADLSESDLSEDEEPDLTVQAPPVALVEAALLAAGDPAFEPPFPQVLEAEPAKKPPERAPAQSPSPKEQTPPPMRSPEPAHSPPHRAPEHTPERRISPEHTPPPQRSPEPKHRLEGGLDATARANALERLRARAKKLTELGSYFPVGDRSSATSAQGTPDSISTNPSHTPVLGSFVQVEERKGE